MPRKKKELITIEDELDTTTLQNKDVSDTIDDKNVKEEKIKKKAEKVVKEKIAKANRTDSVKVTKEGKDETKPLQLAELINEAAKFRKGEIELSDLDELGERMTIRTYIPMLEKLSLVMLIVFNMGQEDTNVNEVRIAKREKDLFFEVLLGAYALVDVTELNLKTYESYDLLYPIFGEYILQYCRKDYEQIVGMIKDSLNIYHMQELSELFDTIDYKKLQEASEQHEKLFQQLEDSKELVANLREMYGLANPAIKQTYESIEKVALKDLHEQEKAVKEALIADGKMSPDAIEKVISEKPKRGRKKKSEE